MNRSRTSRWSFAVSAHSQSLTLGMRRTATAVLIREPAGEIVSVPNGDVEKLDTSPVSLMPPGLTDRLRRDELIDLMRFLTSRGKKDASAK